MPSRVLIVSDSPTLQQEVTEVLESDGLVLLSAESGASGFAAAVSQHPDLIIIDDGIASGEPHDETHDEATSAPRQPSLRLCARLRAEPTTAELPIVFVAGSAASRARALDLGAADVVRIPLEPAELRTRVRATLQLRRCQSLLESRAQLDGLTGLRNRPFFEARVRDAAAACHQRSIPFCLLLIEIDQFAGLQREHGHPFADSVLQIVADQIGGCLRSTDALCRYAGHQLGLVHIGKGQSSAMETARRVQERLLSIRLPAPRHGLLLTASLGVASSDLWEHPGEVTAPGVTSAAEGALEAAQRGGRGRISEARARFSDTLAWRA